MDPDRDELVAQARALAPRIRERAEAAEAARTIPRESVEELVAAHFGRTLVPKRWGGYELGFDTWLAVATELAK